MDVHSNYRFLLALLLTSQLPNEFSCYENMSITHLPSPEFKLINILQLDNFQALDPMMSWV